MAKKLIFSIDDYLKQSFAIFAMLSVVVGYGLIFDPPVKKVNQQKIEEVVNVDKQKQLLTFAYDVAKNDGHKKPEYLQGVLLQESGAGASSKFRVAGDPVKKENRYFGVAQIKLAAALDVMKNFPELWSFLQTKTHDELQAKLILDDEFNIRIASKYLLLMGINKSAHFAITAYNKGIGGAMLVENVSLDPYTQGVLSFASSHIVKKINKT
jgi:hypothetical protein